MIPRTLIYTGFQLRRVVTEPINLIFSMVLPILMYWFINAGSNGTELVYATGANLSAYLMVGFALFGAITAVVSGGALSVVNHLTGWGRQLALTPLTQCHILIAEILQALFRVTLPVTGVFLIGALTGATMSLSSWALTYVLCIACAVPFSFLGMAAAALNPTPSTIGIVSASVSFFAFIGDMFLPLPQSWMWLSRLTPLWGPGLMTRHPVVGNTSTELILAVTNIAAWSIVLVTSYLVLHRRDHNRH